VNVISGFLFYLWLQEDRTCGYLAIYISFFALRRTFSLHHIRRHGFKGGRRRLVRPARPQHWPPSLLCVGDGGEEEVDAGGMQRNLPKQS